jgi:hypothetical protein
VKAVGLRKLKIRLSEDVRQVRNGEEVLATRGLVTIGAPSDSAVYPKLPPALTPGRLTKLLDGERGETVSAVRG